MVWQVAPADGSIPSKAMGFATLKKVRILPSSVFDRVVNGTKVTIFHARTIMLVLESPFAVTTLSLSTMCFYSQVPKEWRCINGVIFHRSVHSW